MRIVNNSDPSPDRYLSVHLELSKYNESVGTRDAIGSKMGFLLYHLTAKL
jgi:hypothetical protein